MGDPFTVVTGAAGFVSLGLTVCQGLVSYYKEWKSYDDDIAHLCERCERLSDIFATLDRTLPSSAPSDRATVAQVKKTVRSCEIALGRLKTARDKCKVCKPVLKNLKIDRVRALYPFQKGTIKSIRDDLTELEAALGIALNLLEMLPPHTQTFMYLQLTI